MEIARGTPRDVLTQRAAVSQSFPYDLAVGVVADGEYAWPALVTLMSASRHTLLKTVCVLLGDRLGRRFVIEAEDLFRAASIPFRYVRVDLDTAADYPLASHLSRATYGRLEIAHATIDLAPRTLYLDADALVVGDIAALARWNLDSHVAGAVRSRIIPNCSSHGGIPDWSELGLRSDAPFFNAGVLLIDNRAWERDSVSARVIDRITTAPDNATFADQGALNAVLYNRWTELPGVWNFEVARGPAVRVGPLVVSRRYNLLLRSVRILHFCQGVKPWHAAYPPGALRAIYRRHWRASLPVAPEAAQSYWTWWRTRRASRHQRP